LVAGAGFEPATSWL